MKRIYESDEDLEEEGKSLVLLLDSGLLTRRQRHTAKRRLTDIVRRVSQVTRSMWMEGTGGKPDGVAESGSRAEVPPVSATPAVAGPARGQLPQQPDKQPVGADVRTNPAPARHEQVHEGKHDEQQRKQAPNPTTPKPERKHKRTKRPRSMPPLVDPPTPSEVPRGKGE